MHPDTVDPNCPVHGHLVRTGRLRVAKGNLKPTVQSPAPTPTVVNARSIAGGPSAVLNAGQERINRVRRFLSPKAPIDNSTPATRAAEQAAFEVNCMPSPTNQMFNARVRAKAGGR